MFVMNVVILVINFVIALATCVAAWGAWKAAKSADEQVKLQRPRPVVIVEGNWGLEDPNGENFVLANIGSSPAFDIEVSDIEGPLLRQAESAERLVTDRTFVIEEKQKQVAPQCRRAPGNILRDQAAFKFIQNAARAFSPKDENGNPTLEHKLIFDVAYSTLDGRRIKTACAIRFNLAIDNLRAQVVPSASWLGEEVPAGAVINHSSTQRGQP